MLNYPRQGSDSLGLRVGGSQHVNQNLHCSFLYYHLPFEQSLPQSRIRNYGFCDSLRCRGSHQ